MTYLLFYKRRRSARASARVCRSRSASATAVAGLVVPLVLVAWATVALRRRARPQSLGWMIQLMFLLVGWHYVKQGFGVLSVLSARRGVRIGPSSAG